MNLIEKIFCKNCKTIISQEESNWEKFCNVCQNSFCSRCIDNHICGEKEQEEAEYNAIHEGKDDNGTFADHLEEIK